jgi:hypothetical protein
MALILVRDLAHGRAQMINTDHVFHCVEVDGGVRILYAQGVSGRDSVVIAGTLEDFAKAVDASSVG